MKDFQDVSVKRLVQNFLFSQVNVQNIKVTGLAGPHPLEYKEMLIKYFNPIDINLVDIPSWNYADEKRKYVTEWNYISRVKATSVMDCDFCDTIINSGNEFLKVYDKMQKLPDKEKILAFTFSTRMSGGIERTLDWISDNLYDGTIKSCDLKGQYIHSSKYRSYIYGISHRQIKFKKSLWVRYRDTSNMLSGIVSW